MVVGGCLFNGAGDVTIRTVHTYIAIYSHPCAHVLKVFLLSAHTHPDHHTQTIGRYARASYHIHYPPNYSTAAIP